MGENWKEKGDEERGGREKKSSHRKRKLYYINNLLLKFVEDGMGKDKGGKLYVAFYCVACQSTCSMAVM